MDQSVLKYNYYLCKYVSVIGIYIQYSTYSNLLIRIVYKYASLYLEVIVYRYKCTIYKYTYK